MKDDCHGCRIWHKDNGIDDEEPQQVSKGCLHNNSKKTESLDTSCEKHKKSPAEYELTAPWDRRNILIVIV